MKSLILLCALAASIIAIVRSDQEWHIELLDPQGFRVLMKHDNGIKSVLMQFQINHPPYGVRNNLLPEDAVDTILGNLTLHSNGNWWVYENFTDSLNPGDRADLVLVNTREENSTDVFPLDDLIIEDYVIPDNAPRVAI